jgi:hypothetical protein
MTGRRDEGNRLNVAERGAFVIAHAVRREQHDLAGSDGC